LLIPGKRAAVDRPVQADRVTSRREDRDETLVRTQALGRVDSRARRGQQAQGGIVDAEPGQRPAAVIGEECRC
jgi:hypothetical protein